MTCKQIKLRCNGIERQNLFANVREKTSLIFYFEMRLVSAREEYIVCCPRKERSGVAWLTAGIWKLRGARKGSVKGRSLCVEQSKMLRIYC
jgi:hypothetical protein